MSEMAPLEIFWTLGEVFLKAFIAGAFFGSVVGIYRRITT